MFLIEADNEATRHLLLGILCSEMLFESYVPHIHSEKVLQPMNLSLWRRGMCTPLSHYIYIFTIAKKTVNVKGFTLQTKQIVKQSFQEKSPGTSAPGLSISLLLSFNSQHVS